jgi:hypothetical protein
MFDSTKPNIQMFFGIVINFLHNKCIDFTYEFIGDENANLVTHSWVGDS